MLKDNSAKYAANKHQQFTKISPSVYVTLAYIKQTKNNATIHKIMLAFPIPAQT